MRCLFVLFARQRLPRVPGRIGPGPSRYKKWPLGGIAMVAAGCLGVGCGGGDFSTASTSGRVVCEGQPVPHATVIFEPLATGKSALTGKQGIGETDDNGEFQLSTYGTRDGAVVGKHRVRVAPPDRDSYPDLKCECDLNPEVDVMQAEVRAGESNRFEISLKRRVGGRPGNR